MTLSHSLAMREDSRRGDHLYIYTQLMLAYAATLALMRFRRTGALSDSDQATLQKLLKLLENIQEGERAITSVSIGLWRVASSESVETFRIVLDILPRLDVQAKDIGPFLDRLHATVQALLAGAVPNDQDLDSLQSFLENYRSYWERQLPRTGC